MSIDRPSYARRKIVTAGVRAGIGGMLALGAGMALEQVDVAARRKRRNSRTRKNVDTSTSTTTSNDAANISVAIGAPGEPGPSVAIDQ